MPEVNLGKVVGPVGPQGPTGPQGPQGVQGVKGEKGDPGSGTAPNLLCNWYFADPVNQRGKTEYMGVKRGYTIDRYYAESKAGKVSVEEHGVRFSSMTEDTAIFIQPMEPALAKVLEGKNVTISALTTDGALFSGTGVFEVGMTANISARHPNNDGSVSCAPFAISLQAIRISVSPGRSMSLLAVKLELGDHQTLAHQENGVWVLNEVPDPALELLRCQRYYKRLSGQGGYISTSGNLIVARAMDRDTAQLWIPTPTPMRATPVVRLYGTLDFGEFDTGLGVTASSVIVGQNAVTCRVTGGEFDFDGVNTHYLHYVDLCETGDYIELDAEL